MTTNHLPLAYPHFRNDLKDKEMITKNIKTLAIATILLTTIANATLTIVIEPFECRTELLNYQELNRMIKRLEGDESRKSERQVYITERTDLKEILEIENCSTRGGHHAK